MTVTAGRNLRGVGSRRRVSLLPEKMPGLSGIYRAGRDPEPSRQLLLVLIPHKNEEAGDKHLGRIIFVGPHVHLGVLVAVAVHHPWALVIIGGRQHVEGKEMGGVIVTGVDAGRPVFQVKVTRGGVREEGIGVLVACAAPAPLDVAVGVAPPYL